MDCCNRPLNGSISTLVETDSSGYFQTGKISKDWHLKSAKPVLNETKHRKEKRILKMVFKNYLISISLILNAMLFWRLNKSYEFEIENCPLRMPFFLRDSGKAFCRPEDYTYFDTKLGLEFCSPALEIGHLVKLPKGR